MILALLKNGNITKLKNYAMNEILWEEMIKSIAGEKIKVDENSSHKNQQKMKKLITSY